MIGHGFEYLLQAGGVEGFLVKLSLLLFISWGLHGLLHAANPQWRVHLWRFTGIAGLLLAVMMFSNVVPKVVVPVRLSSVEPSSKAVAPVAVEPVLETSETAGDNPDLQQISMSIEHRALPEKHRFPWRPVLLSVWMVGVCLGGLRMLLGFVQLRRILQRSQSVPDSVVQAAGRIREGLGLKKAVRLRVVSAVQSPVLIWLGKPVLLLPGYLCGCDGRARLPAVLGHEFSHVRSRDLFWNGYLRVLGTALWFHPLAWFMRRAHVDACELIADSTSARLMDSPRHYQGVVAEIALHAHASVAHMGLAFVWKSNVRYRLERLPKTLRQLPLRRRWIALSLSLAMVAVLAVAGCSLIPRKSFTGVVLLPDGSPAAHAQVYMATHKKMVYAEDGDVKVRGRHQAKADESGRFEIPQVDGRFKLVVVHDAGTLILTRKQWESGRELILQPWGRVEGRMRLGGKVVANEPVGLHPVMLRSSQFDHVDVEWHYSAITDLDGRFVLERIVPGIYRCARTSSDGRYDISVMPAKGVGVLSGSTSEVELSQNGRQVQGRIDWSAVPVPFRKSRVFVDEILDFSRDPALRLDPYENPEQVDRFWRSDEGLAFVDRQVNHQMVACDEQGYFSLDHVRPGSYRLGVFAYVSGDADKYEHRPLGGASLEFQVGPGVDAMDLGTIMVLTNRPERVAVGDRMPNLRFMLVSDGSKQTMDDYQGKPVLLGYECGMFNSEYLAHLIGPDKDVAVVQLVDRWRSSSSISVPGKAFGLKVSLIYGSVENILETNYMLGMGEVSYPEAYLLNDKGTVLDKSANLEELLPYVTGEKAIAGSGNDSSRRFFADTEFCIIKEDGGAAGTIMLMPSGKGMTRLTVFNRVKGDHYQMKIHYAGSRGLKDLYEIEMNHPGGTETVSVEYDGRRTELFDDGVRKIFLRPKVTS